MASQAEVELVVDTSDTLVDLERELTEIVRAAEASADPIEIEALLDSDRSLSELIEDLNQVVELAEAAGDTIAVDAALDSLAALEELRDDLDDVIHEAELAAEAIQLEAEIEADVAQLDAELAALVEELEASAPPVELEVEVDRDGVGRRAINSLGRGLSGILGPLGRVSAGVGALGLAAGASAPLLAAVATSLEAIAPAAALAVSGILTVQLAAGTLKLAMQGVGEAVTAAFDPATKPEELEKALKGLAPSARAFVVELASMRDQLKTIQQTVQQNFFQDLDGVLRELGKTALPVVASALERTSKVLNVMAKEAGAAAVQLAKDGTLGKALDSSVASLDNLALAPGQFVKGLGQIAAAAGPSLERVSAAAADAATRISEKLSAAFESGALEEAIDGAVDAIAQLGRIGGNVFEGLGNIIGTVNGEAGGLFNILEKVTQAFADVTATQGFQQALKALSQTASVLVDEGLKLIVQALQLLGPIFEELGPPVQRLIKLLGESLGRIFEKLGPVLVKVAEAFGKLVPVLEPFVKLATDILVAILPGLIPLFETLGRVFDQIAPFAKQLAENIGAQLLPFLRKLSEDVLPKLLPFLGDLAEKIFPKLTEVLAELEPFLVKLGGALGDLLVTLVPLIEAWIKLQFQIAEKLMPVLEPLAKLIIFLVEGALKLLHFQLVNFIIPGIEILTLLLQGKFSEAWDRAKEAVRDMAEKAERFVRGMVEGIGIQLSNLVRAVSEKAGQMAQQFLDKIRKGGDDAVADFKSLPERVARALGDTATHLIQAGRDFVQGFINGIRSQLGELQSIAQQVAEAVSNPVLKFLGIQSPSRLMREIGHDTMDGMILGIGDKIPDLRSELQGVAALAPSFALPGGQTLRLPDFSAQQPTVQVFIGNEQFNGHIDTRVTEANTARDRLIVNGVRR